MGSVHGGCRDGDDAGGGGGASGGGGFVAGVAARRELPGDGSAASRCSNGSSGASRMRKASAASPCWRANDSLARKLCEGCPPDARVIHCEAADALGRLAEAVRKLPCQGVVRLNVSHPFVDPAPDRSAGGRGRQRRAAITPAIRSAMGGPSCSRSWACLPSGATSMRCCVPIGSRPTAADRAETTRFIYSRPDLFSQKMIAVPPQLDRDDLRLAIHDEEDWEELQQILDALGPESLDWQYIASLLDRQPTIRARMANRNRAAAGVC